MHSCLYHGIVSHCRQTPVVHRFRYWLFWLYVDLSEWEEVERRVVGLSRRFFAPAALNRRDHMGDKAKSLAAEVREFVRRESGEDMATGAIRLLTQPRSFGVYFSPLNLYYCFGAAGELNAVVAEVNNTPWGEQHCYLLWKANRTSAAKGEYRHAKTFHVSPFMPMDQDYLWQVGVPGKDLSVHLATERDGRAYFEADMKLARQELSSWTLASNLARSPVNAARVMVAIYYQALRLWMKKCRYYPHPKTGSPNVPAA